MTFLLLLLLQSLFLSCSSLYCTEDKACSAMFAKEGILGFCSSRSVRGAECVQSSNICHNTEKEAPCHCCKSCVDLACSTRGPGWKCTNSTLAMSLPRGSCPNETPPSCYSLNPEEQCTCCNHGLLTIMPVEPEEPVEPVEPVQPTQPTQPTQPVEPIESIQPVEPTQVIQPVQPPCLDLGCESTMDGRGECVQVEGANWTALSLQYSLEDVHPSMDLCSCGCRCMAKMPVGDVKDVCHDVGCSTQWGGEGVCMDTSCDKFPNMVNDLDLSVGGKHGLCGDAGCCTCFKKKVASPHCPDVNCGSEWGGKGICLDPSSEDFYEIVDDLDLFVGGKKGLCGDLSCCTCFKKK